MRAKVCREEKCCYHNNIEFLHLQFGVIAGFFIFKESGFVCAENLLSIEYCAWLHSSNCGHFARVVKIVFHVFGYFSAISFR